LPTRLQREGSARVGSDPHLVERVQGINVETGHLNVGDRGREFYASKQPTETMCYIAGDDFDLPDICEALDGDVGIAVTGDMCTVYGVIQIVEEPEGAGVLEFDFPSEVMPMFEVRRWVVLGFFDVSDGNEYPELGIMSIIPDTGKLTVRRATIHSLTTDYRIRFGQLQYIKQ
jgi:hypothetical protein